MATKQNGTDKLKRNNIGIKMLTVLKSIIGSLFMAYIKKNAAHLVVDLIIETADKGASYTSTNWDDNEVKKLRENRAHYEDIIKGKIEHLI